MAHYALISAQAGELLGAVIDDGISSYPMAYDDDDYSMLQDACEDINGDVPQSRLRAILHGMPYHKFDGPNKHKGNIISTARFLNAKYDLPLRN